MSVQTHTIGSCLAEARQKLAHGGIDHAALDARLLIAGLLGLSATEMLTHEGAAVSSDDEARIAAALERRLLREPVHRILGAREFYGLNLSLSAATLEPRADTEILVETVLAHLRDLVSPASPLHILDMGAGTGAIGLALLSALPNATVVGSDISEDALKTARANAETNGLADRFHTQCANWFDGIEGHFDAIVSNPPYIASRVVDDLEPEVRCYDPRAALDGGQDGLDAYREIAAGAASFVQPRGLIGLEIGYDQKDAVTQIFSDQGFMLLQAAKDYGGRDRVLIFTTSSEPVSASK
ncbi:peptide chain release factor N(5)-glutamine methyltransferase [Oryzifoliimicrobium ureilyticus]|uniref:peptide chain release factor N(5)-glutamine methyltransferase n=1 Tax=Oryzifoliimicrobium ureilyticus TaxID=3113724 RepID=UPI0030760D2D